MPQRSMRLLTATAMLMVAAAVLRWLPAVGHHPAVATDAARTAAPAIGGSTARVPAPGAAEDGLVSRPEVGFGSHARLVEHFEKHGREFGGISMDDYLRRAQVLRDRPLGGAVLEAVRNDGVITRYDPASGAFIAFDRDAVIRTYFRPNDGAAYFRRQLEREH